MQKISPFLWFDKEAEEAANFYVAIFSGRGLDSKVTQVMPGVNGVASGVTFELAGQRFLSLNGGPHFKFNEAISLFVDCADQEEVDYFWTKLSEGGAESKCGWLKDKYGVSWQIIPKILGEMLHHPDPAKANQAMRAMLQMTKIDVSVFEQIKETAI